MDEKAWQRFMAESNSASDAMAMRWFLWRVKNATSLLLRRLISRFPTRPGS